MPPLSAKPDDHEEPSKHCCVGVSRPPRNMAGPYGSSNFRLQTCLCTDFYAGCTNLHSHQQCTRIPFPVHPHHIFCFVFSWFWAILRWNFNIVLICISLAKKMLNNILCWLTICTFSSTNYQVSSFAHLLIKFLLP